MLPKPRVDARLGDGAPPPPELVCPPSGVTKGPWTVRMTDASVTVRWEACRFGADRTVLLQREDGVGGQLTARSVERAFEVTNTYRAAPYASAPPDLAGIYYMHEVTLEGLAQGACYRYRLGAHAERDGGVSRPVGRFCTSRKPGAKVRFDAIGDTNPFLGDNTTKLLEQMAAEPVDFVVHLGDIQYYDSTLETWAGWFVKMQPLLDRGAFLGAIGNHESEKPDEFDQYTLRFFHQGDKANPGYFQFASGGIHFFTVNTDLSTAPTSEQARFLLDGLNRAKATPGYRMSIVFFHRPFATCGDAGDDEGARALFEPVFADAKVPLVLQGHMHGYERIVFDRITYLTSAGGGGRMGNVDENTSRAYCKRRAAAGPWFHFTRFEIDDKAIHGRAIDTAGKVLDAFDIALP